MDVLVSSCSPGTPGYTGFLLFSRYPWIYWFPPVLKVSMDILVSCCFLGIHGCPGSLQFSRYPWIYWFPSVLHGTSGFPCFLLFSRYLWWSWLPSFLQFRYPLISQFPPVLQVPLNITVSSPLDILVSSCFPGTPGYTGFLLFSMYPWISWYPLFSRDPWISWFPPVLQVSLNILVSSCYPGTPGSMDILVSYCFLCKLSKLAKKGVSLSQVEKVGFGN